eukprot:TRINITY_DN4525_c3_g1_i9.p2 TRINITY_DN4525_c3_g1~~TRINITY_DN4525_c3_g1_i9.p2  ORF type:complete len:208 (-),score=-14.12 TRINITY_DN4525_c3_g1_i9:32-655(-)
MTQSLSVGQSTQLRTCYNHRKSGFVIANYTKSMRQKVIVNTVKKFVHCRENFSPVCDQQLSLLILKAITETAYKKGIATMMISLCIGLRITLQFEPTTIQKKHSEKSGFAIAYIHTQKICDQKVSCDYDEQSVHCRQNYVPICDQQLSLLQTIQTHNTWQNYQYFTNVPFTQTNTLKKPKIHYELAFNKICSYLQPQMRVLSLVVSS